MPLFSGVGDGLRGSCRRWSGTASPCGAPGRRSRSLGRACRCWGCSDSICAASSTRIVSGMSPPRVDIRIGRHCRSTRPAHGPGAKLVCTPDGLGRNAVVAAVEADDGRIGPFIDVDVGEPLCCVDPPFLEIPRGRGCCGCQPACVIVSAVEPAERVVLAVHRGSHALCRIPSALK